jgi:hypothetical protein
MKISGAAQFRSLGVAVRFFHRFRQLQMLNSLNVARALETSLLKNCSERDRVRFWKIEEQKSQANP